MGPQKVWVRVDEAFKGTEAGATLRLEQESHSCAPKFKTGTRIVFYIHPSKTDGAWEAHGCHRTRSLEGGADDLLFLRALPDSGNRRRLSGDVTLYENSVEAGFRRVRPLSGMAVKIVGERTSVEVVTNADGVYEVYDLPEGNYRVEPVYPKGTALQFPMFYGGGSSRLTARVPGAEQGKQTIALQGSGGASIDFVVREENSISGKLVGPKGEPLSGVYVTMLPATGTASRRFSPGKTTDVEGKFTIDDFPAGEYLLVANQSGKLNGKNPFGATYFPGTSKKEEAQPVRVGHGEKVEGLTLRVPTLERTIIVRGRVQFQDGQGVKGAWLQFARAAHREHLPTQSGADGSFELRILAGKVEKLVAQWMANPMLLPKCPEHRAKAGKGLLAQFDSDEYPVGGEQDMEGVTLTLPVVSCKDRP